MAEGVKGRLSGSRHGSQVNVYFVLSIQLFSWDLPLLSCCLE